jgi:nitrous oxide reductase accessory protein NosL
MAPDRFLIVIAIIAAAAIFAGCVEEKTSHTPLPTSSPLPYKIMRS